MKQIALISDIHGNRPALEAVLADIDRRGIATIHCLGDLAGKGPSGAKAVDLCRERCTTIVRGNWDTFLAQPRDLPAVQWWQEELGPERCAWLGTLPFAIDFVLSGQRVRLVHASPQGEFVRVRQSDPVEQLRSLFETTDETDPDFVPDVVGYGDIHTTYLRTFPNQTLFNVGSVGNSLHSSQATYAILEGVIGGTRHDPWSVQIVRVPYDIERAIADARSADAPEQEAWEFELRTATYRGLMPQVAGG